MRRPVPTGPLSPKLLKHFAAATVTLTALLAVFASGEDWGARAQVSAVQTKNQLVKTETEKLGTKRVAATLKVANAPPAASFGDDEDEPDLGGGGGYSSPPQRSAQPVMPPSATSMSGPLRTKARPAPARPPSAQAIAKLTASSARRSGQAVSDD